jgi:hypothetical protein
MNHDLDKLGRQLKDLDELLGKFAAAERRRQLIKIIKVPGWTTPAEFLLVSSIVENITVQLKALESLEANLVKGAELVGKQIKR